MDLDRTRLLTPADAPAWIGLDVGGANLKAADGRGESVSAPFDLWRRPAELPGALCDLLSPFDDVPIAATLTGELADCYATKAEGVRAILDAIVEAAGGRPVRVATVDDRWLTPNEAEGSPRLVAAANWRVAARLVSRAFRGESGVWIDVGSTTTDVIPLGRGLVGARGVTDTERLLNGELVYTGVRRTPVCAVVGALPYRGGDCPVASEWFATTADAWLLLGQFDADPANTDTADGRPFTPAASEARLARCLCADAEVFDSEDALITARAIADAQIALLRNAVRQAANNAEHAFVSGEGGFLARRALEGTLPIHSLQTLLGSQADHLPAHGAAVLASAELGSRS